MKYALIVVCITLFLFYTVVWAVSENGENENPIISSSIYFLCFILIYIFT